MKKLDEVNIEYCRKLRNACLANAEEFVNSAKLLKGKSTAHIRYHLATLAMEEVGKAVIFLIEFSSMTLGKDDMEPNFSIDDHVKKLFWAIHSPLIEQERLTAEKFELHRGLAKGIHQTRLETLYTDSYNPLLPENRIEEEDADRMVRVSELRIEMEKGVDLEDMPEESKREDLLWFLSTSDDPERRSLIFGSPSLDKLAELKNMYEWIKWLRQEFTQSEEEAREILRQEMEKGAVEEDEGNDPKWKVKFRIYSESHTIRPRILNEWNQTSGFIMKLHSSNNRKELICELTLGKRVHLRSLWDTAWRISRDFVAALNIGSMGLFWWHVDKDRSRFYEKISDLENDAEAQVQLSPKLSIDWGNEGRRNETLTEVDLGYTRLIIGYILKTFHSNPRKRQALDMYLTGLALVSKSDIHLRLELHAFSHFFMTLKTLLLASGDWDGVEDLKHAAGVQFGEILSTTENLSDYIEWGIQLEKRNNPRKPITLTEVIGMKTYCDCYFSLLAKREHDRGTSHIADTSSTDSEI